MDHNNRQAEKLLERYKQGLCTEEEIRLLQETLLEFSDSSQVPDSETITDSRDRVWAKLEEETMHIRKRKLWVSAWGYTAAAVVLLAIAAGVYFMRSEQEPAHDFEPGGNRATLTLADGRKVELSPEQEVIIIGDDEITYSDGSGVLDSRQQTTDSRQQTTDDRQADGKESPMSNVSRLMSLTTPKGGTYQIVLPDGSKVWLNASSTLKYPSRFTGDKREILLEGEGFFEVSQQGGAAFALRSSQTANGKKQIAPFIVRTTDQEVQVLGTTFNVSAYPEDDVVKTTLASGAVKVIALKGSTADQSTNQPINQSVLLAPGEQSTLHKNSRLQKEKTDVNSEISWKNNEFIFNNTSLTDIMRQLERWYDIEVADKESLPDKRFYGQMSRQVNLSQVLEMIHETSKLSFTIEERRLSLRKE